MKLFNLKTVDYSIRILGFRGTNSARIYIDKTLGKKEMINAPLDVYNLRDQLIESLENRTPYYFWGIYYEDK